MRLNGNRVRGSGLANGKEVVFLDGSCFMTHLSFPQFSDPLSDFQGWMLNFGLKQSVDIFVQPKSVVPGWVGNPNRSSET